MLRTGFHEMQHTAQDRQVRAPRCQIDRTRLEFCMPSITSITGIVVHFPRRLGGEDRRGLRAHAIPR